MRGVASLVASVTFLALLLPSPALAQSVELTTPYPAVDVEAGESVTFDLEVSSPVRQRVDLAVVEAPEGWTTTLRGGGFVIRGVFADPDSPPTVTLNVDVPADAAEGTYRVVVQARAQSGATASLALDLRVAEVVAEPITLETDFPRLSGGADDTFRFSVTLRNELTTETTFALNATGPEGWDVNASPSLQSRATTVTVASGSTSTINVEATPAAGTPAGEYPITLEVTGGGRTARIELVAVVEGEFAIRLTTPDERLNATGTAGGVTRIPLVVFNDGTAPLRNVDLSASPPANWEVTFEPDSIEEIAPGSSAEVTAVVTPAEEAVVGDYVLTLTASAEGRRSQIDIRFTVETSTLWGLVGVLVIIAALGGLGWVFRRYGRR